MNTPRFNRQYCILPQRLIPNHIVKIYTDVLKDARLLKLYSQPILCLQETLLGIDAPGLTLKLIEQTERAPNIVSTRPAFFPKNANASMTRPDDSLALVFRHIDGFHNYQMLKLAVNYSQSHLQQAINKEQFIDLGQLVVDYKLTDRYTMRDRYYGLVYESIDGFSSKFSSGVQTGTFTVNCKFTGYQSEMLLDGVKILGNENILYVSESLAVAGFQTQEANDLGTTMWPAKSGPKVSQNQSTISQTEIDNLNRKNYLKDAPHLSQETHEAPPPNKLEPER